MDGLALDGHGDVDRQRGGEVDAVVVEVAARGVGAVGDGGDGLAFEALGLGEDLVAGGGDGVETPSRDDLGEAALSRHGAGDLGAHVAERGVGGSGRCAR
ncbi:hypothetical protein GCM10020219_008860 [Nonomuraea dietziae]